MPRRNGKPDVFTSATVPAIKALDAVIQQPEEDTQA
jgi:hypothetical protein